MVVSIVVLFHIPTEQLGEEKHLFIETIDILQFYTLVSFGWDYGILTRGISSTLMQSKPSRQVIKQWDMRYRHTV